jgi:hypothetical protein
MKIGLNVKIIHGPLEGATGITVDLTSPRNDFNDIVIHLDDEFARKYGLRIVGVDRFDVMTYKISSIDDILKG